MSSSKRNRKAVPQAIAMMKHCEHEEEDEAVSISPMGMMPDLQGPIWVNSFTEEAARNFTKILQLQSKQDPTAPILVYIDSYGGEVYALNTMLSALESVPNQIITVAMGKAMSAGAALLAHGDIRYVSPHSTVMIHEMSAGTGGHIDDMKVDQEMLNSLNERLMKALAKKCHIKGGYASLKKTLAKARNLYMTAEEAVKFGIADAVGVPTLFKNMVPQFVLSTNSRGSDNEHAAKETKA